VLIIAGVPAMQSVKLNSGFVELDRRFHKIDTQREREESAFESYTAELFDLGLADSGLNWDTLLENRLAVILGEAGSGKTREFRQRADLLGATGNYAIFIPLEGIANRPLLDSLNSDKRQQFDAWKHGNNEGFFFADSVDEAKFRRIDDFLAALDSLSEAIGRDVERAKIFLSCRISEWRPETDASEVINRFRRPQPIRQKTSESDSAIRPGAEDHSPLVVQLQPLNRKQVEVFAAAQGLADKEGFVSALDRQFAWEFARRPVDVVDLLNYWSTNKRLGSLSELLEFSTARKLRPAERDAADPLPEDRAREGAESLAAASILCRQLNFAVPDAAALTANALDIRACLPADWKSEEIRSLLARPIFDAASYGRIRFHHRRVGEYLTAQWLAARMRDGCPTTELEQILFGGSEELLLRPALAPVAAWLCVGNEPSNQRMREWVLARSPFIFLQYGDAQALPVEYKRRILEAIVQKSANRSRVWIESSRESLSRLADPQLSPDFVKIIEDRRVSQDIRAEMLQVIEHGGIGSCVPSTLKILRSNEESEDLKIYAAAVIRRLGDDHARRELAKIAASWSDIRNTLLGIVCQAIYPSIAGPEALVELLQKARSIKRFGIDLPYYLNSHFEAELTPANAIPLLARLLRLIQTPPYTDERPNALPISREFGWVVKLLPTILRILFREGLLSNSDIENAASALRLLGHMLNHGQITFLDDEKIKELNAATIRHGRVRQEYAWQRIQYHRARKDGLEFFNLTDHHALIQFGSSDLEWMIKDITVRPTAEDRLLALTYAMQFLQFSKQAHCGRRRIRAAIGSDPALRKTYHKMTRQWAFIGPRRFFYQKIRNKIGSRWWWLTKRQALQDRWRNWRDQMRLLKSIRLISSGRAIGWLSYLIREADEHNMSEWTARSWEDLKRKRGERVARATRSGCKKVWRNFTPTLPHENPTPGQTDPRIPVGLTGIQAEVEDGDLSFKVVDSTEAVLMARYAVNELNGFPQWLYSLAEKQPESVGSVLRECIRGEWSFAADRERIHEVMNKLVWRGQNLNTLIYDYVLKLLLNGEPKNFTILRLVVSLVLQGLPASKDSVITIARQRLGSPNTDTQSYSLWMFVLLQLDSRTALDLLEHSLLSAAKPKDVMIQVASFLSPRGLDEKTVITDPDYLSPANIRRLIPLVYEYVRPSEDIDRSGSTYSPGARDHAQQFRGDLIPRLAADSSVEARKAMTELLEEPSLTQHRDWLLHLIDRQKSSAAESPPWTPADVREFALTYEIEPKTDRDLFRIACKRLGELKDEVERAENSLRDDLREGDSELKLRRWLARKLNERSRHKYTVPEEAVIDLEQRPDLRIQNPNTQTVSVEVKWADERSVNDLCERLENQVFGQYLRAHTSTYAIYVIGVAKYRQWQMPQENRAIDFPELIKLLKQRANDLVKARQNFAGVAVFGISFRQPRK
jgi:hypothetical protein